MRFVEFPKLLIECLGLGRRAREDRRRLFARERALGEFADQQQWVLAKARFIDQVEIGTWHAIHCTAGVPDIEVISNAPIAEPIMHAKIRPKNPAIAGRR